MALSFSRSVREKAKLVKVIFHFDASHQQVKFYGKNSIEFFFFQRKLRIGNDHYLQHMS